MKEKERLFLCCVRARDKERERERKTLRKRGAINGDYKRKTEGERKSG